MQKSARPACSPICKITLLHDQHSVTSCTQMLGGAGTVYSGANNSHIKM